VNCLHIIIVFLCSRKGLYEQNAIVVRFGMNGALNSTTPKARLAFRERGALLHLRGLTKGISRQIKIWAQTSNKRTNTVLCVSKDVGT